MTVAGIKQYLRENPFDMLATLNKRSGGIIFCGRSAYHCFGELADRTITRDSVEDKTFDREDYIRALRNTFVELFVEKRSIANQSSVTKFVNRAKQVASMDRVNLTHHIPCTLFYEKDPGTFALGPVTFTRTEKFLKDFDDEIERYCEATQTAFSDGLRNRESDLSEEEVLAKAKGLADRDIGRIKAYYGEYDWVATVTIPQCHESLSKLRAERTVDAALDALRLFVPFYPERYSRANVPNSPCNTCEITSDQSGQIHPTMRFAGKGARAGDGWYGALMEQAASLWDLFGQAIDELRDEEKIEELNRRLLDALNWFGQAVVEPNPAAKVVKYSAALERLTITGHMDNEIEKTVIQRTTFLNKDRTDKTVEQIKEDIGKLYQCRSDLMHGSMSPYSSKVSEVLRIGREVSRSTVLNAGIFFAELRLHAADGRVGRKDLNAAYEFEIIHE
jgi:hypothetical protein